MNLVIRGIYFDGESSKAHIAVIELRDQSLYIEIEEDTSKSNVVKLTEIENIDFSASGALHLKFGEFPFQSILIQDKIDAQFLRESLPKTPSLVSNLYAKVLQGSAMKIVLYSSILLVGIFFLYIQFAAPFIAAKAVNLLPISAEVTIGEKMTQPIFSSLNINEGKSKILTNFFNEVGFESQYPIEVFVVDEQVVNAFAVPGGKIVIYQGLLDIFDSWEQLAAVLAHELAHVELRHSMKQISRSLSTYLVFSIVTSDINGISSVLIDNALMIKDLSNSRSMEKEADIEGLAYLHELKVNPEGMIRLFEALNEESELGDDLNKVLKILSTHPLSTDRISYLESQIKQLPPFEFIQNEKLNHSFNLLKE